VITSLRENPSLKLTMAPNPAIDQVTIQRDDPTTGAWIVVYSTTGIKVASYEVPAGEDELTVDVSGLAQGLYFVEYVNSSGKRTLRLVKL
jgi:hypothetical protein